MPEEIFSGRLALQQRVLPAYRVPFFDALAGACRGGLSVFAGEPGAGESISTAASLAVARYVPASNHHFLTAENPLYVCWQAGLSGWLDEWQPDILVLEANSRNLSSRLGIKWMRDRGKPVIGWGLGLPASGGGIVSRLRNQESLNFIRSFDAMIAYSRRGAQEYLSLGFPDRSVFVASNAVAPLPQSPAPQRPAGFAGKPTVLFIGRLQARKRIENLLAACAALPVALQPRLVIVGEGPARQEFETAAKTVYPSAEFLGERHDTGLDPIFASADLFVLPGTGGLAVQQAMAHGLPVIVAQGDGTQEDLVRPGNGYLVPPGDQAALTRSLQDALSDPVRLRRMGQESYRIVREEINLEKMVQAFISAVNQVASSFAARGG